MGLPRDPADRTPQDWQDIELGGMVLRAIFLGFILGVAAGATVALWLL